MSTHPGILFSHNHHLLAVKGCEAALDVLAFVGDEALSRPFSYRIEFTSADHAISKETMLMKAASLTLQAPVDQGYGIKIQQPVRVIQGVVSGFERLSTSKDETRYALTLQPRLALLDRSHQNAIYQDLSVPQIVEKILRERHGMRGQDFLFSLSKAYPRREQVMQYGEDDLHFITRLLGEVGTVLKTTSVSMTVRNLSAPTLPCYPPDQDRFHWRVLSHLGSGFLSLMDNAEVLRGTLALYEWTQSEMNRRRLEAIIDVQHSETERFEQGYLVRGVQIAVTLDSAGFAGRGDICLFGEMLSRFFALYTDIYLFNRLVIILQPTGERLEWEEKHNRRIPG